MVCAKASPNCALRGEKRAFIICGIQKMRKPDSLLRFLTGLMAPAVRRCGCVASLGRRKSTVEVGAARFKANWVSEN